MFAAVSCLTKFSNYPYDAIMTLVVTIGLSLFNCGSYNPPKKQTNNETVRGEESGLPLSRLKLPDGYKIQIWASDVQNARSLCRGDQGTIFVGTRDEGNVYALKDANGDGVAEERYTLLTGLNMPNGVAFKNGDLYIAEVSRIIKLSNIEAQLRNVPKPEVIFDQYPSETHHGWKYIAFGPDGLLYVPVGAPCNICESKDKVYASITRLKADGSDYEVVQHGVRNTVGFDWHPVSGALWFTDNNRDMMGDDKPSCELNTATKDGQHFGYPYCHQGDLPDPDYGKKRPCSDFVGPAWNVGAHTAPLGCMFYTGTAFPADMKHQLLVCEHGSWNRSKKVGYQVSLARVDAQGKVISYTPFIHGWLDKQKDEAWGRPVDFEQLSDGSVLISDDFANCIYRVTYTGT